MYDSKFVTFKFLHLGSWNQSVFGNFTFYHYSNIEIVHFYVDRLIG